ncbi:MAG: DUF3794 domain-containing protein [Heliobacteriaceae bacterium]|nr:DUF3794 domain-containing protein [Heliobacteriaceae bacterium]MDD4588640.1 DUF3794 domain-containing protein [Heliobacteriaceae bacterium]
MAEFVTCPPLNPQQVPPAALAAISAQVTVAENFDLPCQKPDIENLVSVNVNNVVINRQHIVPTPAVATPGGDIFTGVKLCVEGTIYQTVTYFACGSQVMHAAEFQVPFSAYIVLPPTTPSGIPTIGFNPNLIQVNSVVECCFARMTSPRTIFKNVVLFLYAVFLV